MRFEKPVNPTFGGLCSGSGTELVHGVETRERRRVWREGMHPQRNTIRCGECGRVLDIGDVKRKATGARWPGDPWVLFSVVKAHRPLGTGPGRLKELERREGEWERAGE